MKNIILSKFNPEYPIPLNLISAGENTVQVPVHGKKGYPVYYLAFCTSGSGILKIAGRNDAIEKDTFFLLVPDESYYYAPNNHIMKLAWITFSGEFAGKITESLQLTKNGIGKFNHPDIFCKRFHMIMHLLRENDRKCSFSLSSELYALLMEISYDQHFHDDNTSNTVQKLKTVFKFIESNWNKNIGTREMAEYAGISPQYLCSLFRRSEGVTPREYLIRYRMVKSKELLNNKNHSISDISRLSGFNDSSYFCAVFKKYEGITPNKFRNLIY